MDGYYSHFQNPYSSTPDASGEPVFYQTGPSNTKGVEAESNILIGHGFSLYLNGTLGSAKYAQTGLWVQNAPKNTETVGFTYRVKSWDLGFFNKRIGPMYNDNGSRQPGGRHRPVQREQPVPELHGAGATPTCGAPRSGWASTTCWTNTASSA